MKKINVRIIPVIFGIVTIMSTCVLLCVNSHVAIQSQGALYPKVYFRGEYKIGDGQWQEYQPGIHLSANEGDITLKGTLNKYFVEWKEEVGCVESEEIITFYCDHLMVKIQEKDEQPIVFETELPDYEITCAKNWQFYRYSGNAGEEIEISIHSPHKFGNENAVDEMLDNMYVYIGYDFEEDRIEEGSLQRIIGMMILLSACCMLGISLFAGRIHVRGNRYFWIFAFLMIFAGGYIILSSPNVNLWKASFNFNTAVLGICMMLYQYLITVLVTYILGAKTQKYALSLVHVSGMIPISLVLYSIVSKVHFYGTWGNWALLESAISLSMIFFVWYDTKEIDYNKRLVQVAATAPLLSFLLDVVATDMGWWQGGKISIQIFYVYVLIAFVFVVRIIPQKINEAARAKELEEKQRELQQELKDRRVSVMMSQIRTHFIFNIMTIISGLCNSDPQKADSALILFARYLRKNIAIMDRDEPIFFSQELQHLEDYISLEKMRFGDRIKFEKNLEITDFKIPPLTIQPLVENAIKHGLLSAGRKGCVCLSTKEDDGAIVIVIEDNGIGFEPEALKKSDAVGIRNVRYRVENMVGGTLELSSVVEMGTKAEIRIPQKSNY